ncbi:uncharacterized protein [Gorilla gorilla gorilla]|uniref:uncharacterized protein n=1 Tax=Gorilla gorilla gorilla TaxID=9595 RepID=UPI0024463DBF|nr:uncharacterized protein LOC129525990 [Gorilla gorilla gorilla]
MAVACQVSKRKSEQLEYFFSGTSAQIKGDNQELVKMRGIAVLPSCMPVEEEWWEKREAEKTSKKGVECRSRPGVGGAGRPDAARLLAQECAVQLAGRGRSAAGAGQRTAGAGQAAAADQTRRRAPERRGRGVSGHDPSHRAPRPSRAASAFSARASAPLGSLPAPGSLPPSLPPSSPSLPSWDCLELRTASLPRHFPRGGRARASFGTPGSRNPALRLVPYKLLRAPPAAVGAAAVPLLEVVSWHPRGRRKEEEAAAGALVGGLR